MPENTNNPAKDEPVLPECKAFGGPGAPWHNVQNHCLVDQLNEAVWVLDESRTTTYMNRRMAELLDLETDAAAGKSFASLLPDQVAHDVADLIDESCSRSGVHRREIEIHRRNDRTSFILLKCVHIHPDSSARKGILITATDITEWNEKEHSFKRTREQLEHMVRDLNETRSQMIAEASHELRTPLSIIRESVAIIKEALVGPVTPKQSEMLGVALRNCDRLSAILSRILDLSRLEAGKVEPRREPTDFETLVNEFCRDISGRFSDRDISLRTDIAANLPQGHCDREHIRRILQNLLENALKFTPAKGTVSVSVTHENRFLRVSVEDTGRGIPPERLDDIFKPFIQVDREDGPGDRGAGLGLAIVKQLVDLNRGTIIVESEIGRGSHFSFTVPAYEAAAAKRVLVVDDDTRLVTFMVAVLRKSRLPLEIRSTESGLDALHIIGQFVPDLVILDVHLADVAGQKVLETIIKTNQKPPKVLAISGDASAAIDAVKRGAEDCLDKPFGSGELIAKVVAMLGIERRVGRSS